jgi:hypothetical protein
VWLGRRNTIKLSRVKQQEASYWRQEEKEGAGHVYRFVMEEEEAEDDGEEAAADMVVSLPLWWIGSSASRIRSVSGETGAFGERERERKISAVELAAGGCYTGQEEASVSGCQKISVIRPASTNCVRASSTSCAEPDRWRRRRRTWLA